MEEERDLVCMFEEQCERAAKALVETDALLLVTGAGWSADSGLAVYNDVAKVQAYERRNLEYSDLCQPKHIDSDPELFYGFWGQCFNDYRATKPHGGYEIVCKWRNDKNNEKIAQEIRERMENKIQERKPFDSASVKRNTPFEVPGLAGAFFCFTSNCDGHFYDYLEACELHDCHGNVELWQCSDRDCGGSIFDSVTASDSDDDDSPVIWRAPLQHEFLVDKRTMLCPEKKEVLSTSTVRQEVEDTEQSGAAVAKIGKTTGGSQQRSEETLLRNMPPATANATKMEGSHWYMEDPKSDNWPRCGKCHSLARPAVFMFGDFGWKYDMSQSIRWDLWRDTILEMADERKASSENGSPLKVCIVEVGCGLRVQTCRDTSEQMVTDLVERDWGASPTLVRINPDYPMPSSGDLSLVESTISIKSKGLRAIQRINELYTQKMDEGNR